MYMCILYIQYMYMCIYMYMYTYKMVIVIEKFLQELKVVMQLTIHVHV